MVDSPCSIEGSAPEIGVPISSPPVTAQSKSNIWTWFRARMHPAAIQAGLVFTDQGILSLTTCILGIVLARSVSKNDYGLYIAAMAIVLIVQGFQTALISQPCTVFAPKMDRHERATYLGSTVVHQFGMLILVTLGASVVASSMPLVARDSQYTQIAWLLAGVAGLISLRPFARFLLLSCFRPGLALLMGSMASLAQCGTAFLFFVQGALTMPILLTIIAVTNAVFACLFLWLLGRRKILSINMKSVPEHFRRNWQFGKWGLGRTLTSMFASTIYPIALAALLVPSEAAAYGVCIGLAGIINPTIMGASAFIGPRLAHRARWGDLTDLLKHTTRSLLVTAALLAVYIAVIGLFGEQLLTMLYGAQYRSHGTLVLLVAIAVAMEGIDCPINATISALERPKVLFVTRLLGAIFTLTVGLLMLMKWGALGAVIGLISSNSLSTSGRFIWLWRYFASTTGAQRGGSL